MTITTTHMTKATTARPRARRAMIACAGAGALMVGAAAAANADTEVEPPAEFTSAFTTTATPDNVVDADGEPTPGEEGATGTFTFMINSDTETICYDIALTGVTPPYESPARTATHIHEAEAGAAGPPRLAFPNPTGPNGEETGDVLTSTGCMQGPFTTGIEDDEGEDTGAGFSLTQIEEDPSAFFGDTHTSQFTAGAVRGQLQQIPVGGVETGFGGTAMANADTGMSTALLAGAGIAGVGAIALTSAVVVRRQRG